MIAFTLAGTHMLGIIRDFYVVFPAICHMQQSVAAVKHTGNHFYSLIAIKYYVDFTFF